MDPCELAIAISALACAIAQKLDDDELELAAVVFSQLGDTLATVAMQRERINKSGFIQ